MGKTLDPQPNHHLREVEVCSDGGIVVVGSARGYNLWKLAPSGQMLWQRYFRWPYHSYPTSVKECSDGGFIIAGWVHGKANYTESEVWLVRTDEEGYELWNASFGGSEEDYAYSVIESSDGGFAIAGETYSFSGGERSNAWLIKTDSQGNELWNTSFGRGNTHDWANYICESSDGGLVLAGRTGSFTNTGVYDGWLIKTDRQGNELWNISFGEGNFDYVKSVQECRDHGFILAGTTHAKLNDYGNGSAWLIRTDANGTKLWDRSFGRIKLDNGWRALEVSDGGFILAVTHENPLNSRYQAGLIRTDALGNLLWNKTLLESEGHADCSLAITGDGDYIFSNHERILRLPKRPTPLVTIKETKPLSFNPGNVTITLSGEARDLGTDHIFLRYVWHSDIDGELYNSSWPIIFPLTLSRAEHLINFRVMDHNGFWGEDQRILDLREEPRAIILDISPTLAIAGADIRFQGACSNPGQNLRYVWTSSLDGELYNGSNSTFTSHTILSPGNHGISLRIQDSNGFWTTESHSRPLVLSEFRIHLDRRTQWVIPGSPVTIAGTLIGPEGWGEWNDLDITITLEYIETSPTGTTTIQFSEELTRSNESFSRNVTIPANLRDGRHTFKVTARLPGGYRASDSLGFVYGELQDWDQDGIPNEYDDYPLDHDNDGIPDEYDPDDDNDGKLDTWDDYPLDCDNDGVPGSSQSGYWGEGNGLVVPEETEVGEEEGLALTDSWTLVVIILIAVAGTGFLFTNRSKR
jgi:hypothetical protein